VTATLNFFKKINFGIAFICGEEKKAKFDELISGQSSPAQLPALGWKNIKNVEIFTDIQKKKRLK
jgi:6-phosphogluconolactonase/glucosamine-6-phosphate isomerase/deaminase